MAVELRLAPEVELDLTEAYDWYEQRRTGLGEEFIGCIDVCLRQIRRAPDRYPMVHATYRRALVRRFPYAVYYEHKGTP